MFHIAKQESLEHIITFTKALRQQRTCWQIVFFQRSGVSAGFLCSREQEQEAAFLLLLGMGWVAGGLHYPGDCHLQYWWGLHLWLPLFSHFYLAGGCGMCWESVAPEVFTFVCGCCGVEASCSIAGFEGQSAQFSLTKGLLGKWDLWSFPQRQGLSQGTAFLWAFTL